MAKATLVWAGMDEYREALRNLPESCLGEAGKLIEGETNAAYFTIASYYAAHVVSGHLRDGLKLTPITRKGQLTTGLVLTSSGALAWLFDRGSVTRQYYTVHGVKHVTGRMPASHIFEGTVAAARRRLSAAYRALMVRAGAAQVTGE